MNVKFYIIGLVIFFSSLLGLSARAGDLVDTQSVSATHAYNLNWSAGWRVAGQLITPGHNNISKVEIKLYKYDDVSVANTYLSICEGTPSIISAADAVSNLSTCNYSGNTQLFRQLIHGVASSSPEYYIYDLPTPVEVTPSTQHYFVLSFGTEEANSIEPKYALGTGGLVNENSSSIELGWVSYYDDAWVPTPDWSITAISPLTGSTVATTSLQVAFNIPTDEIGIINYFLQFPDYTIKQYDTVQYEGSGTSTRSLVLLDGNYSWSSYLIDYNTYSPVASTTWQNFTVKKLGSITFSLPFGLSEDDVCLGVATTTSYTNLHFLGDIECGLKKTVAWALNPSESSINMLYDAYLDLQGKFPFSAYFGLTTALNDAISTTTPATDGSIGVPMINSSGDYYILPVIASSSLGNAIGQTNASLFRTTIGYLMWLAVGFIIFLQFKRI